jgi:hypothetical protein
VNLINLANIADIERTHACEMLEHVIKAIIFLPDFAYNSGIGEQSILQIQATHRITIMW